MNQKERYQQAKKITLLGAFVNAFLGLLKLFGGIIFHSHALAADGVHSFSDLFIDVMVLVASKYSNQDADSSHPYGHQRIETAATLILALVLILAGIGIAWDALDEILHHLHEVPSFFAFLIAFFSIVANEGLFHYTYFIGQRIQSDLVIANAWHHRSDAASSLVVMIGIMGSLLGWVYLDGVAAIIVGILIIHLGWSYGWNSVKELVDTAVDPEALATIEQTIQEVPGVKEIHQLRSRSMGRDVFVDVHIQVAPYISVSEGHFIAQQVHYALLKNISQIKDVTVHIDPENDEVDCPSRHLPNRYLLEHSYLFNWRKQFPGIEFWQLHYVEGSITIDLICNHEFHQWKALEERVTEDLQDQIDVTTVRLLTQHQTIVLAKNMM